MFGRESADELQDVRDWARGSLRDATDAEVYSIVQYFVQRVRNYTHLDSLTSLRLSSAIVDGCHANRKVNVAAATNRLRWFKTLSLYEYGQWVYGKDHGFPPFGIECTCRMEGIMPGV